MKRLSKIKFFLRHLSINLIYNFGFNEDGMMSFSWHIDLSITNYSSVLWKLSFLEILRPIIYGILFKNLHRFWSWTSYCTLGKLLNLLSNLNSLKLSSLLIAEINSDENNLCINNKIRKSLPIDRSYSNGIFYENVFIYGISWK